MKAYYKKYLNRETLSYLFFGVLTTIVNYFVFWFVIQLWGTQVSLLANVVAFVFATAFAYITNKLYVFQSKSWTYAVIKKEMIAFVSTRICSFLFEELGLFFCSSILQVDQWEVMGINGIFIAKVILSMIVVAINYVLSKWFIFNSKKV